MDAFQAILKLILDQTSLSQIQQQIQNANLQANVKVNTGNAQKQVNKLASDLSRMSKANTMQSWADNNSRAMKKFGGELTQIINKMKNLSSPMTQEEQTKMMTRFKEIQLSARETGLLGKTFTDSLTGEMKSFARWTVASTLIMAPIKAMRDAIGVMKEVDSELVNIQKVTNATAEEMKNLTKEAYAMATAYGRSPVEFLKSVTEFSRAGYGDISSELGELSLLTQNVGDVEEELADKFLISADAAWKYGGNIESLRAILDGFNELSNRTATTVDNLADGITVAGSVFAQAGLSAQDYAGIIGTATAKTQRDGNEMARAWRTILMNIRQIQGTDLETGEVIDSDKLAQAESTLNEIGISIREVVDGQSELRKPMAVISELAGKWEDLSSIQQAAIQEALAGRLLPERIEMCA